MEYAPGMANSPGLTVEFESTISLLISQTKKYLCLINYHLKKRLSLKQKMIFFKYYEQGYQQKMWISFYAKSLAFSRALIHS